MLKKLWLDEGGALLSVELILLIVITVIGITVGMVVLRDAVVAEFQDVAAAIDSIDPGYGWAGLTYTDDNSIGSSSAYVDGSAYSSATAAPDTIAVLSDVVATDPPVESDKGNVTVIAIP